MKKILVALAVLVSGLFAVNQGNAQMVPGSNFSIGVSPMLPIGDWSDNYSFGVGGDLQYGYNFDESIGLTLSAGYNNFFMKDSDFKTVAENLGAKTSIGIVPVKAGVKYGIGSFYLHPQLGVGIPTTENNILGAKAKYDPGFLYGIGVGTNVAGFDLSLRYEASDHKFNVSGNTSKDKANLGFLGLRLGYTFPMGR